jgi:hypothetical protein
VGMRAHAPSFVEYDAVRVRGRENGKDVRCLSCSLTVHLVIRFLGCTVRGAGAVYGVDV